MTTWSRLAAFCLGAVLLAACARTRLPPPGPIAASEVPAPAREFRAAWIATVDNIDWPSRPGLSVPDQQAELRTLLDRAVLLGLNAVVFQVRPTADALYASDLEPWSSYLTGASGKAPEPFYDPLAFAVDEAHRRGLELHAWFNPFRAYHPSAPDSLAASHIARTHPHLVKQYGDLRWLDPGEFEARHHSIRVILDVVRRYDVDGVHLDDYFYPYQIRDAANRWVPFPDSASWVATVAGRGPLSRSDWRRENVDLFVEHLYREIKRVKPRVKFGISPFGIWRPGHPPQIRGFDAYEGLYADARKWLQNGWVDYFSPQLYWAVDQEAQSYPVLLAWWREQNTRARHLWPGNFASRVIADDATRWTPEEILRQIELTRAQEGATGNIHFSMKALNPERSRLGADLAEAAYTAPALVPASPWLDPSVPGTPSVALETIAGADVVTLSPPEDEPVWLWVVRTRRGDTWNTTILPGWHHVHRPAGDSGQGPVNAVAVSVVNRVGTEGPLRIIERPLP